MSLNRPSARLIFDVIVTIFALTAVGCGAISKGASTNPAPTAQTITFGPIQSQAIGTAVTLSATASSNLPVSLTSSTPGVCTVAGTTANLVATGTCTIEANQAGNAVYAAAPAVGQSFAVTSNAQTITFGPIANQPVGTIVALSATASSGLPVTYTASAASAGVCTVSASSVSTIGFGTCTIAADQAGNATFAAAQEVSQSFAVIGDAQTITFGPIANQLLASPPAQLMLTGTASSGLPISYASTTASACTVSGSTATLIASGVCTIVASQAGNGMFLPATPVAESFNISIQTQTITFGAIAPQTLATPPAPLATVPLLATASSGLPVAFSSSTNAVCTVAGTTATLVASGTCTILANQPGNVTYSAAPQVMQSFGVNGVAQTITFPAIATQAIGTPLVLMATASSGLPVSFASSTPLVCTIANSVASFIASGSCTIVAAQAGNSTYAAAPQVAQSFAVNGEAQTITFLAITPQTVGTQLTLSATATSGLPVSFASSTPGICTVTGTTASFAASGSCTITATQAGNGTYAAAPPVAQSFAVNGEAQTITFPPIGTLTVGSPLTLSATASSNLQVSFASSTPTVCTVSGTTASLLAAGTCTIQATQAGNATFAAAAPVSQSFAVNGDGQTITFGPIPTQNVATPLTLTATASSGLLVSFASTTPTTCSVTGTTATMIALGTCTIVATQPGNATFAAAPSVSVSFDVDGEVQTITFNPIATQTLGVAPPALTATATSGLPVSFASNTPSVCTVSGTVITLVTSGICTIEATQAGNSTFAAAAPVTQGFTVNGKTQTINFTVIPTQTVPAQPTLTATASSGLPVTFASTTPLICTVSGTTATMAASGTCTIQANQAGNAVWAAATVSQSFGVNGELQTITFNNPGPQYIGTPLTLAATASSGLTVNFASTTQPVCTVSGITATFVTTGACTIVASQAGNSTFAAAAPVSQSFTVFVALGTAPGTLSYSANPAIYTIGTPITTNVLTDSIDTNATYSVSPALPGGLSLDPATGDITGTPTTQVVNGSYTVTASTGGGNSTVILIITVNFTPATPTQYGYAVPSPEPALPPYFDSFTPPYFAPNAAAPGVAEWTRSAAQGNAVELSLAALTANTGFVVYGQTGADETLPFNVTPLVLDTAPTLIPAITAGQIASMLLPTAADGLSNGMYLTWPQNGIGYGNPVAINRTEAWWAGPLSATVGDTVSVYGRNLTYPGTYSADATPPLVYLVGIGGATTTVPVIAANPYKVDFSVALVVPGTYNIWIHNGAGGHFGWSEVQGISQGTYGPATLTVSATPPWDCESSGASSFNVKAATYGATGDGATDDTAAITGAITDAGSYAAHSSHPYATVYFPAGTYMVTTGFQPPSNVCFMGAGTNNWQNQNPSTPTASILRLSATSTTCTAPAPGSVQSEGAFIFADENGASGGSNNVEFTEMVLDSNGNIPCLEMTASSGNSIATQATQIRFRNEHNVKFDHIVLNGTGAGVSTNGGSGFASFDFSNGVNYYLTDSTIIGSGIDNIGTSQVFITGNTFLETDNAASVMDNISLTGTAFWGNTMEDLKKFNTDAVADGDPSAQIPYNVGSASLQAAFASSYNTPSGLYVSNIGPYGLGRIGGSDTLETGLLYIGQNINLNAGPCDPTNTGGSYPSSYPDCYSATNQNAGEQVLFETPDTDFGGFALTSSSNTVEVSGLTATSCGLTPTGPCVGEDAVIVGGKGVGQNRHIIAQSGDTVTVAPAWQVIPDATSRVYIGNVTYQVAVYDNIEQGKADYVNRNTSLAGVETLSNVYGLVYDSNQVSNVVNGINDATVGAYDRTTQDWIVPNYFNLFTNNTVKGAYTGISISDLTLNSPGDAGDQFAVSYVGDIFRNNILGTADTTTPVNTGIIHTGIDIVPCPTSICTAIAYQGGDTIQGIVLDGNTVIVNPFNYSGVYWPLPGTEVPAGLWTDAGPAPIIDLLMNNNSFTLLPNSTSGYSGQSYGISFGSTNSSTPAQPTASDSCVETGNNIPHGFATAMPGAPINFACTAK